MRRTQNSSVIAAHANNAPISVYRTCTVVRGVNGTTAASASQADAITKYAPPADVSTLCLGEAIALLKQGQSGWTGQIGGGEGSVDIRNSAALVDLREKVLASYGLVTL